MAGGQETGCPSIKDGHPSLLKTKPLHLHFSSTEQSLPSGDSHLLPEAGLHAWGMELCNTDALGPTEKLAKASWRALNVDALFPGCLGVWSIIFLSLLQRGVAVGLVLCSFSKSQDLDEAIRSCAGNGAANAAASTLVVRAVIWLSPCLAVR